MNKSTLKAEFINAKIKDAKYIGVSIKTEGSSQPEIIINRGKGQRLERIDCRSD